MTALTADAVRPTRDRGLRSYKMADNVKIYKGSIVCLDTNGYANIGANTTGFVCVGIAYEQVDNTLVGHAAGGKRIRVQSGVHVQMPGLSFTQASVGLAAYVTDSASCSGSESNSILLGVITEYVSATSVWVFIYDPTSPVIAVSSGVTSTSGEINTLHSVTAGTVAASKAVVVDASKNISQFGTIGAAAITVTAVSASSLAVGRQGATNPVLQVDASTATVLTGILIKGAGTGAGAAISVVETGGTNNALTVDAMGSGVVNIGGTSTGVVVLGRGANKAPVFSLLKTDVNTQNAAPTAAQFLGGYITHNSQTGAGTLTTPTGANISAAIPGVAVGDAFYCTYQNRGNQTVTLTAGDGNVTLKGTVAVATLKDSILLFVNTGASTWDVVQVLGG